MMDFSTIRSIVIPEGFVTKIRLANNVLWQSVASIICKNWVQYSTEADGETIYNDGLGYKEGWRVRSSGEELDNDPYAVCTGYIPYKKGDKLYIYPSFIGTNIANAINFFNSSFECLGQITDSGAVYGFCTSAFKTKVVDDLSVLDISDINVSGIEDVAYVRVTNYFRASDALIKSGSEMFITKNERRRFIDTYQPVEWLEAETDSNTYIDLGFSFDTKAKIKIGLDCNYPDNTPGYPFGAVEVEGTLRCALTCPYSSSDYAYAYGTYLDGSNQAYHVVTFNTEKKINDIEITWQSPRLTVFNKTNNFTRDSDLEQINYTMTSNLYLFAQNYNGSPRFGQFRKISYFEYYDKNDKLICNLIPVYRKSDRVPGMYDLSRKVFLTNIGTDEFAVGPNRYTNRIPLSTNVDGSRFIGSNGEKGYLLDFRCSVTGGGYQEKTGYSCTGLIPCRCNDTLQVQYLHVNDNIILFDKNRTILTRADPTTVFNGAIPQADGTIYEGKLDATVFENVAYIVINSGSYMTEKSIATINEEIEE